MFEAILAWFFCKKNGHDYWEQIAIGRKMLIGKCVRCGKEKNETN